MNPLLRGIEDILNQALRTDPETLAALASLQGKAIQIELHGLPMQFMLLPGADGIVLLDEAPREPDASIRGAPLTLLRLLLQEQVNMTGETDIQIDGDVSLLQRFFVLMKGLQIDWEGQLARFSGDIFANQIGNLFRNSQTLVQQQQQTMQQNLSEYLQEEARHLPPRAEVEVFMQAVDVMRDDVERLAQRIAQLSQTKH